MKPALLKRAFAVCMSVAFATAARASAQAVHEETLIPDSTVQRVIAVYNRAGTMRFTGDSRLPAGASLTGDVAAMNGTLEIGAHVTGDVVAINADIHLLATAVIDGSVTAAGGTVRLDDGAAVHGDAASYRELVRVRMENDQIRFVPHEEDTDIASGRGFAFGRTDLLIAMRGSYNRAEGLPIAVGPRFRIGAASDTRLQALLTYRTATGFKADAADKFGYRAEIDHHFGSGLRADGALFREITAIEDWDLSDREASLAAFVLHHDYRDHYDRRGWSIGAHLQRNGGPADFGILYRDETDKSVAPRDPLSILHNGDAWRAEPLVAEGRLHSATATFSYDTRNDIADPADGWLIHGSFEQGLGGSLHTLADAGLPFAQNEDHFSIATVDIRRYARLTPYSRLAVRVRAAGSLDANAAPLPAQRQITLGGEGSLPAYSMAFFDCGARREVLSDGRVATAFHGCDRLALTQIEYQSSFPFARRIAENLRLGSWLTNSVRWAAFFDAGRAWNEPDSRNGRERGREDFSADTGLGLHLGPLGVYWAVPLSGSSHNYNIFMRLGPRL